MKKILFVIVLFVVSPIKADDWLLSLEDIRYQIRMASGQDSAADSYMTDSLGSNFIREGFVAVNTALQPIRTVNSIISTKYQNSYQLDTLQMGIYSVEWTARDTVKTLVYAARETWKTIPKEVTLKIKPGFYDFDHDSIYIHPTPIAADTLLIYGWEKAPDLDTITTLAFLRQAYRLAVLKYATWQAAMARQHPMAGEFKAQYGEALANLRISLGRGCPLWLVSRILLFLFCFGSVVAQQPGTLKKIELRNLRGLNTIATDLTIQPNELRIAHDVDFGATVGGMTTRKGFTTVSTIAGMDSILGIYGAYYSDGSQQLFIVADSDGVGYGNVYVTQKGSVNIADVPDSLTRIWQYWGVQERPSFSQHGDNVYIVNSQQKGIVWNGKIARTWPPNAPGEPLIIPLNDTATTGYGLDGTYRYFLYVDSVPSGSSTPNTRTILSSSINVKNSKVLITDLMWPQDDSLTSIDTSTTSDSIRFALWRTKGDFGVLDRSDSVWLLTDTRTTVANYGALAGLVIIDSTADTSLSIGHVIIVDSLLGRDSLGVIRTYLGAPGYVSMDTTPSYSQARTDSAALYGIFHGVPSAGLGDTMGVAYACTFVDTLTGWESDTGRSLIVWVDSLAFGVGNPPYSITITLPNVPSGSTGLIKNLYRANLMKINSGAKFAVLDSAETAYLTQLQRQIESADNPYTKNRLIQEMNRFTKQHSINISDSRGWRKLVPVDSILLDDFLLLTQFADTQSIYGDSVRYDSLAATGEVYLKGSLDRPPTQIFSFEDRIWSVDGSNLWKSSLLSSILDTVPFFTQVPAVTLNRDDGDQITLTFPARGVIRVFKNFSNYNVYQNANLEWARTEVSGTFGCIATNSYARGFSGHYYLTDAGVVRENEGPNLERTQSIELVSAKIKSFDQMSLVDKAAAIGFYSDRKYMIHIPAAGTTYVYDERANAWSTWSLLFEGATNYGVETELGFFPGDTMYFFNGSVLYRFGTSISVDNSIAVTMRWQTGTLFPDGKRQTIEKVGVWIRQNASEQYLSKIAVINEAGTVSDSITFDQTDNPARYEVRSVATNLGVFLLLNGRHTPSLSGPLPSLIDGIDIWYRDMDEVLVE